jgi:hypothetical protein
MAHYAIYLGQPRGQRLLHPKYKSKRSQPSAIVYFPYAGRFYEFLGDPVGYNKVWVDDALNDLYHELNQLLSDYKINYKIAFIEQFLIKTQRSSVEPWMKDWISFNTDSPSHVLDDLFNIVTLAYKEGGTVILFVD